MVRTGGEVLKTGKSTVAAEGLALGQEAAIAGAVRAGAQHLQGLQGPGVPEPHGVRRAGDEEVRPGAKLRREAGAEEACRQELLGDGSWKGTALPPLGYGTPHQIEDRAEGPSKLEDEVPTTSRYC